MAGVLYKLSIMHVYGHLAESHSGIPRCTELCKMYAFMFIWN